MNYNLIIHPELELVEGFYEEKVDRGSDRIYSPLLTKNDLTAERVLQGN